MINVRRRLPCMLFLLLMVHGSLGARGPVQLKPSPQKFRTFYSLTNPAVTSALRENAVALPAGGVTATARATDGAIRLGASLIAAARW